MGQRITYEIEEVARRTTRITVDVEENELDTLTHDQLAQRAISKANLQLQRTAPTFSYSWKIMRRETLAEVNP